MPYRCFPYRQIIAAVVVASSHVCGGRAGPLEDAAAAYERGDTPAALQLWTPLANGGDAGAQIAIGGLYADGNGVKQSYADAMT